MQSSSEIIQFYLGADVHPDHYIIDQVWKWSDLEINDKHSFVQWLFPLNVALQVSSSSPILSKKDIGLFRTEQELKRRLLISFTMMLRFFGLTIQFKDRAIIVVKSEDFEEKLCKPFDKGMTWYREHHFKRISRMLRSMTLLGLEQPADAFYYALKDLHKSNKERIPVSTYLFWKDAVGK
jgi:hypothetical protein